VRLAFGAGQRSVVRQVDGGAAEDVAIGPEKRGKLATCPPKCPPFDGYISQPSGDTEHSWVCWHNRVVAREQQHPMRAGGIELAEPAERSTGSAERSADSRRQHPVAAEHFSASPERVQPQLQRWTGHGNGGFQGRPGGADDRVGRQDMGPSKRGKRGFTPGWQCLPREHFPGKQRKRVAWRRWQKAIKTL
jgi:hypothetical protein